MSTSSPESGMLPTAKTAGAAVFESGSQRGAGALRRTVAPFEAQAVAAGDLVVDRIGRLCLFVHRDGGASLTADQDRLVTDGRARAARNLDHELVHAHAADLPALVTADEHAHLVAQD